MRSTLAPTVYAAPEDMVLAYNLIIEGVSQGDRAESEVIDLRRELLGCEQIRATFDSLKLASLRKRSNRSGLNMREFRLEGKTADGGEQ